MQHTDQTASEDLGAFLAEINAKPAEMCIYCKHPTIKDDGDRRYVDHVREHLAPSNGPFVKHSMLRTNAKGTSSAQQPADKLSM